MKSNTISTYKELAREAKRRMRMNNYAVSEQLRESGLMGKKFALGGKYLSIEETYEYYCKISSFLEDGLVCCAVGNLLDMDALAKMSPTEKERLVFKTAQLYREMKSDYDKHRNSARK
ncbi:MAG: hypothetical protein LBE09_00885 [Christensenellaceae bacterium]|nr:hypothetical protein [Christensenellaceae bacterium]